jgi:hypothetical protein
MPDKPPESIDQARRELDAMNSIIDALEPLEDDNARRRVLASAWCLHSDVAANAALFTLSRTKGTE